MQGKSEIHCQNLKRLFNPESVAVVGTNDVKGSVPYDILFNIIDSGFTGTVHPVSPGTSSINNIKTYKYVIDIEAPVDLAILVFPAAVIHLALEQCGQKGIKAVIIISAGFREIGGNGIAREQQIKAIADKYDISFVGPNCLGVINTDPNVRLNASFARAMPEAGPIAFLSQSGALCTAVLDYARARHIGFSKFISFGNKTDISEVDLLYYLMADEQTKVILLYLEEISDGRALMEAAQEVIHKSGKPILVIKSGRTEAGASAAASHTGSLAGSDTICEAALKQAGIIRCNNMVELFDRSVAFAYQPPPAGDKVAIITNAGGPGVLTTDAVIHNGLHLATFSDQTAKYLKRHLPSTANRSNPIDVIGDARIDRYNAAMKATFEEADVDAVFVILTPQSMTDIELIAQEVVTVSRQYNKPVYTSFMGETDVRAGIEILQKHGIPNYTIPESMADALRCVFNFHQRGRVNDIIHFDAINRNMARAVIQRGQKRGQTVLPEDEALALLEAYDFPTIPHKIATSAEEAGELFIHLSQSVAMKIVSPDIYHKTDVGGVILGVKTRDDAVIAYETIVQKIREKEPQAAINGVLMTPMIKNGEEVILGMKRDVAFGPVLMFGLGGILVEIYQDISLRVAPITNQQAHEMIEAVKAYALLRGYRGQSSKDIDAIKNCLLRLSQLVMDHPEIEELDINPLIVKEKSCFVADVKIKISGA